MISIIICSRTPVLSKSLYNNIEETIGVPYEIIYIDNSNNDYSIFKAYNLGVKRSNFPYLCFMHDDISYESTNWGELIVNYFSDNNIGAIGIAGTPYYPKMPGSWWGSGIIFEHILQSTDCQREPILKSSTIGSGEQEVVAFDGVWFCIRKSSFKRIWFDDTNFNGFHFYDIDISMQMYEAGIRMYCISDVLIHHTSMGQLSNDWIKSALKFHAKWSKKLPVKCLTFKYVHCCKAEYRALNEFISICKSNGFTPQQIYSVAIKSLLSFKKGYFFYKTPIYLLRYLHQYVNGSISQKFNVLTHKN